MNHNERDPLRQFKSETEDLLFANLHFDTQLKVRVLQSIEAENKRLSMKDQLRQSRIKWIVGVMSVAVVICVFIFASLGFQQETITKSMESPLKEKAFLDKIPPFIMSEKENSDKGSGQIGSKPSPKFQLNSIDEAKTWYGAGLLVATFTPAHFLLDSIQAYGQNIGIADTIVISYVFDDRSYEIKQQILDSPVSFYSEEKVDVHGNVAYITTNTLDCTFLQWVDDGVYYSVSGLISKEEALLVARSLYE